VIKVGTSSLIRPDTNSVNLTNIAKICEAVRGLLDAGAQRNEAPAPAWLSANKLCSATVTLHAAAVLHAGSWPIGLADSGVE
jgi:hypothetical protein